MFLIAYAVLLLIFQGFEPSVGNIIVKVDTAVFGEAHIYHDWVPGGRIALDPEGLLGLIPSIAHVLIGYLCGMIVIVKMKNDLTPLLLVGALLTICGFTLDAGIPIKKSMVSNVRHGELRHRRFAACAAYLHH
ncbi:MAG: hypothetical protein NC301_06035 [Bacteroides sp.]|nr:hypothetical protein [Bacteroides sp.]MCM1379021.1 hypothetical protein [Bacteroides sp.]MCM1445637.1 hypothetical protein [Prevotella sp.]